MTLWWTPSWTSRVIWIPPIEVSVQKVKSLNCLVTQRQNHFEISWIKNCTKREKFEKVIFLLICFKNCIVFCAKSRYINKLKKRVNYNSCFISVSFLKWISKFIVIRTLLVFVHYFNFRKFKLKFFKPQVIQTFSILLFF